MLVRCLKGGKCKSLKKTKEFHDSFFAVACKNLKTLQEPRKIGKSWSANSNFLLERQKKNPIFVSQVPNLFNVVSTKLSRKVFCNNRRDGFLQKMTFPTKMLGPAQTSVF